MANSQNVKIVFLDGDHAHPLAISPSAFEQIKAITAANQVCQVCASPYVKRNPMVVRNTCLHCFMQSDVVKREKPLSIVGEFGRDLKGVRQYKFLDSDGYVYLTDSGSETTRLERSIHATLMHWGFRLPESVIRNERTIALDTHSWHIYGNFRINPVIVCRYKEYYGTHLEAVFFVYKYAPGVEINKRLRVVQQLFQQARAQLEGTKTRSLEDSDLYPVISDLLSQQLLIPTEE
jgi:hypothetical protein